MLRIAIFTYSTKPRGGVVHSLALAEHLRALGHHVHIFALGQNDRGNFYRPTTVPFTIIPTEDIPLEDEALDGRIRRYIQTYYQFLKRDLQRDLPVSYDLFHAQDCISANALWRLREEGLISGFIRTVHHVDDFVSPSLIECQFNSILRPDHRIVVSGYWQKRLGNEFGVDSTVIFNGVDLSRFQPANSAQRTAARDQLGMADRFVFLNIGGIEPRKNSIRLLRAFQAVQPDLKHQGVSPLLVIAGGYTLLDYEEYRAQFFDELAASGLEQGKDVMLMGVVPDETIPLLYQAADVLTFPSVKEGWGLVVLEAMASGLPVLTSDLPVFREYLRSNENALLINPSDEDAMAAAIRDLVADNQLRRRLHLAGPATAEKFSWAATARNHSDLYHRLLAGGFSDQSASRKLILEEKE